MDKSKISYIAFGILAVFVIVLWYFNISLSSIPTTFPKMLDKQISQDEQLTITNLDTDRIHQIRIEKPYTSIDEQEVFVIDDKDEISSLLNQELHIYNGGRWKESREEYDLYIHFYGSTHRYTFAEGYIKTFDGNYKVLDENNVIFHYINSLYEEK